ncbi:MAG: hypothetical protein ACOCZ7_00170 [Armatimonadota bacterium]
MSKPAPVRKQEEEADALIKRMAEPQDTSEDAQGGAEDATGNEDAEGDTPADQSAQGDQGADSGGEATQDGDSQPSSEQGTQDTGKEQEKTLEQLYEELKQAHRTLRGKYDAEVPRLTRELRQAQADRDEAQKEAENLRQQIESAGSAAGDSAAGGSDRLKELEEEYGPDFMEAVRLVVKHEYGESKKADQPRQPQQPQKEQRQDSPEPSGQGEQIPAHVFSELDGLVPDWRKIDVREDFISWLDGTDPFSGVVRKQALHNAARQGDSVRVASIFEEFKERAGLDRPAAHSRQQQDSQAELERQVAPGKGKGQASREAPRAQYTVQDYQNLQEEVRRGKWRGREKEAEEKERAILADIMG